MTTTSPTMSETVRLGLDAAIRAPSPHNSQPWRFEVTGARIDVLLDRDRVLDVVDARAREARLSCGAAVLNIRVALLA
ncbi:MAG TPA: nitroreductase family protein, partial [Amycolatopsis sp.]|nr:nitroreductase family protein [Amycolatopsis sp.]